METKTATRLKSQVFEACISGSDHSLVLPEEIVLPFLEKNLKRVKVKASFEGKDFVFHAAIQKIKGNYYMTFGKRYQKELGVFPNDYFQLQLFEDDSKYGVEMPEEMDAVIESDLEAKELFESLTPGKKRGLIYAIARYKNPQLRIDKSLLICENLKRGIRDSKNLLKP